MGSVMSVQHLRIGSRLRGKLLLATAAASLLAGCADSSRISDPFGNPFGSSAAVDRSPTGSVPQTRQPRMTPPTKASTGAIESTPLPAPSNSAPVASPPKAAFAPPAAPVAPVASTAPRSSGATSGNWSAQGGTPIVVAQGENLKMIGERYGVPTDALLKTNGFSSAAQVQPGARMTIPVYSAGGHAAIATPAAAPVVAKTVTTKPAGKEKLQLVKGPAPAKAAKADEEDEDEKPAKAAKPSKLDAKKAKIAKADEDDGEDEKPAAKATKPVTKPAAIKPVAKVEPVKKVETARVEPAAVAAPETKKATVDQSTTASVPPVAEKAPSESANPEFRWPARGRVIQGFKSGGNDGINIAVPEGTAVKAAEDGVVAYAGSELKGYGNLVLIRHPNGFVSAYAHNGALDVKRGETVKRGQTIAKSGQSGNVSSPQLHFELRKGSTPVDPSGFLAGT